jgi:broad specificity phosphatase PhoE
MKHLILIRHGLPHEGHPILPNDPPLMADGHRHAERLADRLKHEGIDRIVCSPQQRAIDTATPLVRTLGLPLEIIEGLAEVDRFAGRYRSGETLFAEGRWEEFIAAPARYMGRDPEEYRSTVLGAFAQLANDVKGSRVAVFSHGMTIKTILCAVLGLSDEAFALFSTGHCSVSRLSGDGFTANHAAKVKSMKRMKVESINETLASAIKDP